MGAAWAWAWAKGSSEDGGAPLRRSWRVPCPTGRMQQQTGPGARNHWPWQSAEAWSNWRAPGLSSTHSVQPQLSCQGSPSRRPSGRVVRSTLLFHPVARKRLAPCPESARALVARGPGPPRAAHNGVLVARPTSSPPSVQSKTLLPRRNPSTPRPPSILSPYWSPARRAPSARRARP